jgi:hypothetical protein
MKTATQVLCALRAKQVFSHLKVRFQATAVLLAPMDMLMRTMILQHLAMENHPGVPPARTQTLCPVVRLSAYRVLLVRPTTIAMQRRSAMIVRWAASLDPATRLAPFVPLVLLM